MPRFSSSLFRAKSCDISGLRISEFGFKVPRELAAVRQATARLRELLNACNLPGEAMDACELALAEACNNAIQHGRGQIDLCVDVCLFEGRLEMRVWDSGPGFELPAEPRLPENDAERGRGLFLIHSLMDAVAVETLGGLHCLAMRKNLPTSLLRAKYRQGRA